MAILTARVTPIHLKIKGQISSSACQYLTFPTIHRVEFTKVGRPEQHDTGEIIKIVPQILGYF